MLTQIKTNSQCLHFIWGTKIGRAVNSSGQQNSDENCENDSGYSQERREEILSKSMWQKITWKRFRRLRRMAAKFCQIDVQKNYVKTIPVTQKNGGEILSKSMWQKITWKRFRWLRRMEAKFCQILKSWISLQFMWSWLWKNGRDIFGKSFCSEMSLRYKKWC